MDTKTKEFYDRLKGELEKDKTWPGVYLYKFIVPGNPENIARIEEAFDKTDADIQLRNSSKGSFTSVSVKVTMPSAQAIVDKYIELSTIEGLLSL
jgi:putative lipoic acid-binding regulatory protein